MVDLDAGTVEISQQVLEVGGRLVLGPPKSEASRRTVTLDADSVAMLARYRAALGSPSTGFLVASRTGGPIRPKRLTTALRRIAADAGLPPIRRHDLRHGAASLALAADADLKVVQDMLGHASLVLTADTYTSVLPDLDRSVVERVAALIREAAPGRPKAPPRRGRDGRDGSAMGPSVVSDSVPDRRQRSA